MNVNLIMATCVDQSGHYVVGDSNKLPWKCPEEMKFFKETTMDSTVIMGYNTAKSLNFKPLPGRYNLVVADQSRFKADDPIFDSDINVISFENLNCILNEIPPWDKYHKDSTIFIIGGANLYSYILEMHFPKIENIFMSIIDEQFINTEIKDPVYFTPPMWKMLSNRFETIVDVPNKFRVLQYERSKI